MTFSCRDVRRRTALLAAALVAVNLLAWLWASAVCDDNAVLGGIALLAYGFGLRHAVDADHIAAIDNVTRKLMQERQRPIAVGFFFALGHSTVVVAAAIVIAMTAHSLEERVPGLAAVGDAIGTSLSAAFLFVIAATNLAALVGLGRMLRRVRQSGGWTETELCSLLAQRGLFARLCRGLSRLISRSWHMYPLGALFALGFDTASEVGLLGLSAAAAVKGLSFWSVLAFPALFAAGMSLVDSIDGILMVGAYGWALTDPLRKLRYNLAVTGLSVVVAVVIGGVEVLALIGRKTGLTGGAWRTVESAANNFAILGFGIIAAFAAIWVAWFLIWRASARSESGAS